MKKNLLEAIGATVMLCLVVIALYVTLPVIIRVVQNIVISANSDWYEVLK